MIGSSPISSSIGISPSGFTNYTSFFFSHCHTASKGLIVLINNTKVENVYFTFEPVVVSVGVILAVVVEDTKI